MTREPHSHHSLFPAIELTGPAEAEVLQSNDVPTLLRHLILVQQRQTELLESLVQQVGAAQRQRATELGQWKQANPRLARRCRKAAEALSQVQTEFLENLTRDIDENFDGLLEGEFLLNEFVDRYGPRLAHLNGVLQMLSQLSSVSNSAPQAS